LPIRQIRRLIVNTWLIVPWSGCRNLASVGCLHALQRICHVVIFSASFAIGANSGSS
jgi:hypothetical protein